MKKYQTRKLSSWSRKEIYSFIIISETKSFTLAAEKLHLSSMAVSKQIKNLEHSIKEQLFIRTTRQVNLTEFGERFYLQCKELEQQWQQIDLFINSHKLEPQGKLRICISRSFGQKIFMQKLKAFNLSYSKIELEVQFSEEPKVADFEAGKFDILFGFPELPGITDQLKYKKLYKTKNILCASKEFIKKYGMPEKAEELVNFKYLNHSLRQPLNAIPLANGKSILTAKPEIVMNSFECLTQACLDGCGIFLTGDLLVEKHLKNGLLIELLTSQKYREFELYLFYRPMHYEQPNIRAFIDFYKK